ncbi:hypothetical protein Tco_1111947 [Tanacetum coccineum]|uniref:Uncharacterized protein n=1 Tax=Tanacetum coccineum TaxID=301880 RepID=A0ABQ5INE2_9ASTR
MNENHELYNESYVLYDRVMNPLAAQQERKTRKDRGTRRDRHSTSSSSAFDQPSSSHLNDDDDGNREGTACASTLCQLERNDGTIQCESNLFQSYALSWKPCQGDSLNLPDHRYQDYQDKDCQGRLLEIFQDDAKYEHVGQDTRSQDGRDDNDKQGKDLNISKLKTKSKRKSSDQRSHSMKEQAYNKDKDQEQDSRTQCQSNLKKSKTIRPDKISNGDQSGLGEHLAPMECPDKIPIEDQSGFGAWFANRVWGWRVVAPPQTRPIAIPNDNASAISSLKYFTDLPNVTPRQGGNTRHNVNGIVTTH